MLNYFKKMILFAGALSIPQGGGSSTPGSCCKARCAAASQFSADFLQEAVRMTEVGRSNAKSEVLDLIQGLQKSGYVIRTGQDAALRPAYVGAQAEMEKAMAYLLSRQQISELIGIIHTPMPATPLCTEGEVSSELVDPSLAADERRMYTVKERSTIVREYLQQGGVLYVAYPQGGREKWTSAQLAIYDRLREQYPSTLIDSALNCAQLDRDMVGATYLFKNPQGGWICFGIQAPQANAPNDDQKWGIWYGSLDNPQVKQRLKSVLKYLSDCGGPDLLSDFHFRGKSA